MTELFPNTTTELPEKWYVERNRSNYKIVNEFFSKINNRKYSDNGYHKYIYQGDVRVIEQNYLHYPPVVKRRCVFDIPQKGYKEISVEQLQKIVMQKEITKDNWYIRGGIELVKLLSDKNINSSTTQGLNVTMAYYISRLNPKKWESWSVASIKKSRKEITVDEFKEFVIPLLLNSEEKTELPEKWFIRGGDKDLMAYLKHTGSDYAGDVRIYGYYINENGVWCTTNTFEYDKVEITYEQFWNSLQKDKKHMEKLELPPQTKLIGYKLKYPEYNKAALAICQTNSWKSNDISFEYNSIARMALEEAEVLDKWFDPVYEEVPELPMIKNHTASIVGKNIKYGCALLPIAWFKASENRSIVSFTTSNGVYIGEREVIEIRKYLEYHGK